MSETGGINPFNYPSLNRKDLMNLSKITSRDENIRKIKNRINTKREYSNNLETSDLSGKVKF